MAQNDDSFSDLIRSLEQNLQHGEDWRPPDEDAPTRERGNPRRFLWFLIPLLIFVFFNQIIGFIADWFWYDSLDLTSVLFTRIVAKMGLFLAGAVLFWLIVAFNVWLARRISPNGLYGTALEETVSAFGIRVVPTILVVGSHPRLLRGHLYGVRLGKRAAVLEPVQLWPVRSDFWPRCGLLHLHAADLAVDSLVDDVHVDRFTGRCRVGEWNRLARLGYPHSGARAPGCAWRTDSRPDRLAIPHQRLSARV